MEHVAGGLKVMLPLPLPRCSEEVEAVSHGSPEAASFKELSILVGLLPDPPANCVASFGDDSAAAATGTARPGLQPPACSSMHWPWSCWQAQGCASWASSVCVLAIGAGVYVLGFSFFMQQLSLACVLSACAGVTAHQLPPALGLPCALPVRVHSRCCLRQQQLPQQPLLGRPQPQRWVQTAAAETLPEQPHE